VVLGDAIKRTRIASFDDRRRTTPLTSAIWINKPVLSRRKIEEDSL